MKSLWIFIILSAGMSLHARADQPGVTETYTVDTTIQGEPVSQMIHIFPEAPSENPQFIDQINQLPLDHIAFFEESEDGQGRGPSASDDYNETKTKVQAQSQKPVIVVQAKTGFFAMVRKNWRAAFPKIDRTDLAARAAHRSAVRYALISTSTKLATYLVMVVTAKSFGLDAAILMASTQALMGYVQNAYNENISTLTSASLREFGKKANKRDFFLRKLGYYALIAQTYKIAELRAGAFTPKVWADIGMNTLMYGVGDIAVSNKMYQVYHDAEGKPDKVKIDRMNFWIGSISGLFVALDLMKHRSMPVLFHLSSYEFRLSGAILIAYYPGLYYAVSKHPDWTYQKVFSFESALNATGQMIAHPRKWFQAQVADCDSIMQGVDSPEKTIQ